MSATDRNGGRESLWGINRRDRRWFQALTLVGGASTSLAFGLLLFRNRSASDTPDEILFNLLLGIGAGFVASGFVAWGLLQLKEIVVAIADWIREATKKRQRRLLEQGRAEGRDEGYRLGYDDAQRGKPPQIPPDDPGTNGPAP